MKSKWLFFFVMVMILLPMVVGSSFYIPQSTNYSIKFNCKIDGAVCSSTAACNVSIEYPNTTTMVDNEAATLISNARFNYSLTDDQTSVLAEDYRFTAVCYDGNLNGSETITFGVNPSGISPSGERTDSLSRAIYFVFIIGILLFVAFLFSNQSTPVKWTFFGFSIVFFIFQKKS